MTPERHAGRGEEGGTLRWLPRVLRWPASASLLALAMGCASAPHSRGEQPRPPPDRAHTEPDLVPAPVGIRHRVAPGQTLYRIARTYGVSVEALAEANGLTDPTAVAAGMELVVPQPANAGEIAPPAAVESEASSATRGRSELPPATPRAHTAGRASRPASLPRGSGALAWPLRGVLYARFGSKGRQRHDGIDLAAPAGTPVRTAKEGKVLYAGEQKGYGLIAVVDHGDGLLTLYAHNRDLRVKTGQRVRNGQVISTVGESGRTSGPHLHFEVREEGVPVDPLAYLGAPPDRRALGRRSHDP